MKVEFAELGRAFVVDFPKLRHINGADIANLAEVVAAFLLGEGTTAELSMLTRCFKAPRSAISDVMLRPSSSTVNVLVILMA